MEKAPESKKFPVSAAMNKETLSRLVTLLNEGGACTKEFSPGIIGVTLLVNNFLEYGDYIINYSDGSMDLHRRGNPQNREKNDKTKEVAGRS